MKDNIVIKKNVLSNNIFNEMTDVLLNNNFPWYFLPDSAFTEKKLKQEDIGINYSWFHLLYNQGEINSNYYNSYYFPLMIILENFNYNINSLIRARLGLTTTIGKPVINKPHVDWDFPHTTILFYLNDSDGNTIFYKNDNKSIIKEITPTANMCVKFDGSIPHSSSKPVKSQKRVVLNLNVKDK